MLLMRLHCALNGFGLPYQLLRDVLFNKNIYIYCIKNFTHKYVLCMYDRCIFYALKSCCCWFCHFWSKLPKNSPTTKQQSRLRLTNPNRTHSSIFGRSSASSSALMCICIILLNTFIGSMLQVLLLFFCNILLFGSSLLERTCVIHKIFINSLLKVLLISISFCDFTYFLLFLTAGNSFKHLSTFKTYRLSEKLSILVI